MIRRRFWMAVLSVSLIPSFASADLRQYFDAQEYDVVSEGHRETQVFTELRDPEHGDSYFANETGFEYGASNLYTVGIFGHFIEGVGFSAARLVNRFRITEPNAMPVNMAVQFEIKDANDHKDQDQIQGIFIVSKDINQFNLTANPALQLNREFESDGDDKWEADLALALAANYKTGTNVTPSLELYIADDQTRLVPGAAIDLQSNVRLNIGAGIGLDDDADDLQLKTLLSVDF